MTGREGCQRACAYDRAANGDIAGDMRMFAEHGVMGGSYLFRSGCGWIHRRMLRVGSGCCGFLLERLSRRLKLLWRHIGIVLGNELLDQCRVGVLLEGCQSGRCLVGGNLVVCACIVVVCECLQIGMVRILKHSISPEHCRTYTEARRKGSMAYGLKHHVTPTAVYHTRHSLCVSWLRA